MNSIIFFGQREGHVPLFHELCRFHEIDRRTQKLLQLVTQKFCPDKPALIFVDPQWIRLACKSEEFSDSFEELRDLLDKWFG